MVQVSAILPVYNEEKYISNCLNSLLAQSQKSLEIIVVDDGSTDSTLKILKSFEKKYSNVRVFKKNHAGPGEARNFGAKQAKGKILVFPDADEEFPKDYIEKLVIPILEKKAKSTSPVRGKLNPKSNIFSKLKFAEFNKKFGVESKGTTVYRAISKKLFLSIGGYNTKTDYFDDSSLFNKVKSTPMLVDTYAFTTFSSSPIEIIIDSAWGVKSNINKGDNKPIFYCVVLSLLLIIFLVLVLINQVIIIALFILLGIIGWYKTGMIIAVLIYPFIFISKSIGLFLGVYRGIFLKDYKGK